MSGRDIGGGYLTAIEVRETASDRKAALRAANRCINGPTENRPGRRGIVHGEVVPGTGKCARCVEAARRSRV